MSSGFAEGDSPPAPTPRLTVTAEDPDAALQHISSELQLAQPLIDLSDEAEERRLVQAARLQIAHSRQQLLASLVMLGINRIVVTDGLIHAKVVFAMRASDFARRQARTSMYDRAQQKSQTSISASYGGWLSPFSGDMQSTSSTDHIATVESDASGASAGRDADAVDYPDTGAEVSGKSCSEETLSLINFVKPQLTIRLQVAFN